MACKLLEKTRENKMSMGLSKATSRTSFQEIENLNRTNINQMLKKMGVHKANRMTLLRFYRTKMMPNNNKILM